MIEFPRPTKVVNDKGCIAILVFVGGRCREEYWETKHRRCVIHDGLVWRASRLSYNLNVEKIPNTPETLKEGIVCHHCDNPWCINPEHLYLGTASQNTKDIYARNQFIKERMSASKIGNTNRRGYRESEENRRKLSRAKIGNHNSWKISIIINGVAYRTIGVAKKTTWRLAQEKRWRRIDL